MFNQFIKNKKFDILNYPVKEYNTFITLNKYYSREIRKVTYYYTKQITRFVKSEHILVRLLKYIDVRYSNDLLDFNHKLSEVAPIISRHFDFSSNINIGRVFKNALYDDSFEIFLYTENYFDVFQFSENWKTSTPIRVIKSSLTDLDFSFPSQTKSFTSDQFFIYELDIIKLYTQFIHWQNSKLTKGENPSPEVFIATFILPSLISQIINYSLYNRYMKISLNREIIKQPTRHPIIFLDYSTKIDNCLKYISNELKDTRIYFRELLDTIPNFSTSYTSEIISLESRFFTIQCEWVLWIARIDDIVNFFKLMGKYKNVMISQIVYTLPITLRRIKNNMSLIKRVLPISLFLEFENNFNYLLEHK